MGLNVLSLYIVQGISFLTPLLTLMWVARAVGPLCMGGLGIAQSFATFISLVVDYGFAFSASRMAAQHRDDPNKLSQVLSAVIMAKMTLGICAVAVGFVVSRFIPGMSGNLALSTFSLLYGFAFALNMSWFLLVTERMFPVAMFEATVRVLGALATYFLVSRPGDEWMVLATQALVATLTAVWGFLVGSRGLKLRLSSIGEVRAVLREGFQMFVFRLSETAYTSGTSVILSAFCPIAVVGLFAGAERICRTITSGLLDPLQKTVFPVVTRKLNVSWMDAASVVRTTAVFSFCLALAACGILWAASPLVVRVALGNQFLPAVGPMRILLIVPLAISLKWSFGLNWMVPIGLSSELNSIVIASGVLFAGLSIGFAHSFGATGIAAAVALTEVFVPLSAWLLLRRRGLDPFSKVASRHQRKEKMTWFTQNAA